MTPLLTDDEMPALPEPEGACAACGFGDGIYQASHMRAHARAVEARVREKMGESDEMRRYRWLMDWLERRHLLHAEFCQPDSDTPAGDYITFWTPFRRSCPIGWGKTPEEAIDRAIAESTPPPGAGEKR